MSGLDDAGRALVRVSAAVAAWSVGRAAADDVAWALRTGGEEAPAEAVEEALLQSYLFLGYPTALNALALWREVSGRRAGRDGEADPGAHDPGRPGDGGDPKGWEERGERVCRTVYGGQYDRLRDNVRALHPDMERWMVVEGYGKVLGRPGLGLKERELCIVALLAVTGWSTQLYSHLRGALHAGAGEGEVAEALEAALALADEAAGRSARASWERVRERTTGI